MAFQLTLNHLAIQVILRPDLIQKAM